MITLDPYIVGTAALIVGWWMMIFFTGLLAGCGGINYKKFVMTGFLGTGLIILFMGCIQYITIFISSM